MKFIKDILFLLVFPVPSGPSQSVSLLFIFVSSKNHQKFHFGFGPIFVNIWRFFLKPESFYKNDGNFYFDNGTKKCPQFPSGLLLNYIYLYLLNNFLSISVLMQNKRKNLVPSFTTFRHFQVLDLRSRRCSSRSRSRSARWPFASGTRSESVRP